MFPIYSKLDKIQRNGNCINRCCDKISTTLYLRQNFPIPQINHISFPGINAIFSLFSCVIFMYQHHIYKSIPIIFGIMIDQHNDKLPVGLIAQLVEHCTFFEFLKKL